MIVFGGAHGVLLPRPTKNTSVHDHYAVAFCAKRGRTSGFA